MIIETAAEMPLAEAYRTHIYEPLGMTSTFLDCYEEPVIDIVHGYTGAGDDGRRHRTARIGWLVGRRPLFPLPQT